MKRTPFTVDDAQRLKFIRDAGFVAGGRHGFYSVSETDDKARETRSLWLFDRGSSAVRRLGEELGDLGAVAPSPDGEWFAVLADVDGRRQLCLVPVDGGAARTLTSLPQGVTGDLAWSPDGHSIAFTAGPAEVRDPSLPYRIDRPTYRFDGIGYLDDAAQDIHVVDVTSAVVRRLTGDRCVNTEPRWSPDGRSLAYLVSFPPDRAWTQEPDVHVMTVETGRSRAVVHRWGAVLGMEWSADGERIVFVGASSATGRALTQKSDVWVVDVAGGEPRCRTANLLAGVGTRIQVDLPSWVELTSPRIRIHEGDAYVAGQVGGDMVIYRVGLSGPEAVERVPGMDRSVYLIDVDEEGDVLHLATSIVEPPELMLGPTRVTALNDALLAGVARPDVRRLTVTAPDGVRTDAWALTPPGEDGPWPTVLYVHGGPYGAFGDTYMIDFQLLVGAGFAVVFHNFRGSGGYGSEFLQKIVGKWGAAGSLDHHATVDEAVRAGIADPERLGVCGYSHGGFATCWLVGTSDRFKAAVAENPVTSWTTAYGVVDSETWIARELGGTPHEAPDNYRARSPLTHAPNCRTPLLFVIGEHDMRCHPVEAEQYYRVLTANGVPTEMLRLPNSSHIGTWNGPVPARMAQNEALVEWFTRYLS